jgi:hypothetical protein
MGGGTWTRRAFTTYSTSMGRTVSADNCCVTDSLSNQEMFKARTIDPMLNPYKVLRECVDSDEHPNTIPIILALDVTGSMGQAAVEVAKKINKIMTNLYDKLTDVEFMIMGIGDVECDDFPIQISQFESDIRIAEQLDKVYFEFGGGGNSYESYTSAWYMGLNHTKLDCWNRGRKGILITIGDERLNPFLRYSGLNRVTGDNVQNIETPTLYEQAREKFDIYHIDVDHGHRWDTGIDKSWELLGDNYKKANIDNIDDVIVEIIINSTTNSVNNDGLISW